MRLSLKISIVSIRKWEQIGKVYTFPTIQIENFVTVECKMSAFPTLNFDKIGSQTVVSINTWW
jgi:hypothetical protein